MSTNQKPICGIANRQGPAPSFHGEAPKGRSQQQQQQHHQGDATPAPSQRSAQPPAPNKLSAPTTLPSQQTKGKEPPRHKQPGRLQPPGALRGGSGAAAASRRGGFAEKKKRPADRQSRRAPEPEPRDDSGDKQQREREQKQEGGPGSFRVVDKVQFDQFYFPVDREEMERDAEEHGLTVGLKHSRWAPEKSR